MILVNGYILAIVIHGYYLKTLVEVIVLLVIRLKVEEIVGDIPVPRVI